MILIVVLVSSCSKWTLMGTLTMMSTRNVDSKLDYVELARYVDSESKDAKNALKRTTVETGKKVEAAVDRCVAVVPGGEFLKNVHIYLNGSDVKVIGDVWGKKTGYSLTIEQQKSQMKEMERDSIEKERRVRADLKKKEKEEVNKMQLEEKKKHAESFQIGDKVTWNNFGKYIIGEIVGMDSSKAVVKYLDRNGNEQLKKINYQAMTKVVK